MSESNINNESPEMQDLSCAKPSSGDSIFETYQLIAESIQDLAEYNRAIELLIMIGAPLEILVLWLLIFICKYLNL